ncbi:hypothetical protein [Antarcticibacterium sp. 1MA-6-2]|nr:hypothetical protein [Antarcticibacterium sp. 1MA-6-2]
MIKAREINDWSKILEKSYRHAEENFKIKKISQTYERFYKEILN